LVDAKRPELGLYFDGRVSEDFKLATGTWVSVGTLRTAGIEALAPLAQDIVVAGQDRNEIGFLIFPNASACRAMCPDLPAESPLERVLGHPTVVEHIRRGLQRLRAANTGSSTYAARALLMSEPPSIDGGEITDKGYINQRAVLARRSELITALYAPDWNPQVIRCV
jgi:feruloyl-CoA synthase